jgi:SepF-like predicted cell division protein (DUF552 family)
MGDKIKKPEKTKTPEKPSSSSAGFQAKIYLKALPLRSLDDVATVKEEVRSGNILILRVSPLAKKSVEDVERAVDELCKFVESLGGDIARLGEERVVVTPSSVRIWREKETAASETKTPTAA